MNSPLTVSVIICCYTEDRLDDIREAVASVEAQTRPPEEMILAVDNNAPLYELLRDDMAERAEVVLNDKVRGLSATRNRGIKSAHGEVIAFLDDDAVATENWLERLVAVFDDPHVVGAGGRAILDWAAGRPRWFPEDLDWIVGGSFTWLAPRRAEVRNPHGHNMIFRRVAFDSVGLFDYAMGRVGNGGQAAEEAELSLRITHHLPESKIVYEPGAVVHHKVPSHRGRLRYVIKRSYQEGRSKARIQYLWRAHRSNSLFTEGIYLRHLVFRSIPWRLARFWRPRALAQVVAIALCIIATLTGYVKGKRRLERVSNPEGQRA